jgi:hypothetical protein
MLYMTARLATTAYLAIQFTRVCKHAKLALMPEFLDVVKTDGEAEEPKIATDRATAMVNLLFVELSIEPTYLVFFVRKIAADDVLTN